MIESASIGPDNNYSETEFILNAKRENFRKEIRKDNIRELLNMKRLKLITSLAPSDNFTSSKVLSK